MIQMQADEVPVGSDTTCLPNFHRHDTARQIARVQILGCGSVASHEGVRPPCCTGCLLLLGSTSWGSNPFEGTAQIPDLGVAVPAELPLPHPSPLHVRADVHDK